MANTPFLLEARFSFNPSLQQTFRLPPLRSFPIKLSSGNNHAFKLKYTPYPYKGIKYSPKLRTKCFCLSPKPKGENGVGGNTCREDNDLKAVAISSSMKEASWRSIKNVLKTLQYPLGVLLGLLFLYDHHHGSVALAASGGRMGGSSFSSSSSSPQSSYSSTSYSSSTTPTSSYSSSSYSSYSSSSSYPTSYGLGGNRRADEGELLASIFILVVVCFVYMVCEMIRIMNKILTQILSRILPASKTSILKLQLTGRSMQKDLNRIAETADTSSHRGLSYILQETTLALLRHPDYCISCYSTVDAKRKVEEVEKIFNQLSIEERGKFDEETLVNVNNIRKQSATAQRSNGFRNEYIVITIIVAAGGIHKLPPINSSAQLKEALQKLASIPSSKVMAAEVLWTPQNENDTLTEQELLEDYSLLRPL